MIPRIRHAMTPHNPLRLTIPGNVKQKLPTILPRVPSLRGKTAGDMLQSLHKRLPNKTQHTLPEILRARAHRQGHDHAQIIVQVARRVRVYGERTARLRDVMVYQAGVAAADDGDGCCVRETREIGGVE